MVTTFDEVIASAIDRDDDEEEFSVTVDMRPVKNCPKVDPNKRARREMMPDNEHWVEVRGGGSLQERIWIQRVGEKHDAIQKEDAIEAHLWSMRRYGTFLAARLVEHNLTDKVGDPLPNNGMELVYQLSFGEVLWICNRANNATAIFALPKAEKISSGGIATAD